MAKPTGSLLRLAATGAALLWVGPAVAVLAHALGSEHFLFFIGNCFGSDVEEIIGNIPQQLEHGMSRRY